MMHKKTFLKNAISTMVLFFTMTLSAQFGAKEPIFQDMTSPIAIAQDVSVQLDAYGDVEITASQVNSGWSNDSDKVTSYKQAIENFFKETSANNFSTDYENFDKPLDEWTTVIDSSNVQISYLLGTCDNQPYLFLKMKNNNNFKVSLNWTLFLEGPESPLELSANSEVTGTCLSQIKHFKYLIIPGIEITSDGPPLELTSLILSK
ncbi:MAG: hypothetical protein ACI9D4_002470 [Polaribacter sp.]|jgi:hypothetical protein